MLHLQYDISSPAVHWSAERAGGGRVSLYWFEQSNTCKYKQGWDVMLSFDDDIGHALRDAFVDDADDDAIYSTYNPQRYGTYTLW